MEQHLQRSETKLSSIQDQLTEIVRLLNDYRPSEEEQLLHLLADRRRAALERYRAEWTGPLYRHSSEDGEDEID